jgi:hypothetical protein
MATTEAQLRHIEEHSEKFNHYITDTPIRDYFDDYGHITDLYQRVCSDLEIEPLSDNTKRFTIKWKSDHYTVSVPNYEGGEVVSAEEYDRLKTVLDDIAYEEGVDLRVAQSMARSVLKEAV